MSSSNSIRLLAAATIFLASSAIAENGAEPAQVSPTAIHPLEPTSVITQPLVTEAQDRQPPVVGEAVSDNELGELRGGEAMVLSNQTLVAITSGNIINGNYVAGNISLSDHSLSNFNGLGNVLINTGAQVSLQTGMNVTINVGD